MINVKCVSSHRVSSNYLVETWNKLRICKLEIRCQVANINGECIIKLSTKKLYPGQVLWLTTWPWAFIVSHRD